MVGVLHLPLRVPNWEVIYINTPSQSESYKKSNFTVFRNLLILFSLFPIIFLKNLYIYLLLFSPISLILSKRLCHHIIIDIYFKWAMDHTYAIMTIQCQNFDYGFKLLCSNSLWFWKMKINILRFNSLWFFKNKINILRFKQREKKQWFLIQI
jgi:hypothetical protein